MVEELWEEVKLMPTKILHKEVASWVLELGTTAGRASAYDYMLMIYWVTKSSVARESKCEGDEEPVKFWKEHYSECHPMH